MRIVIALVFFMSFISYLAYRSFQENIDLVADNYYEKEVEFQKKIDSRNNALSLTNKVMWDKSDEYLFVQLPEDLDGDMLTGSVAFLCPSEKEKDVKLNFSTNGSENVLTIALSDFVRGPYRMKLEWRTSSTSYYYEELIVF